MLTIGIDFGTTNCSAAVFHDGHPELIPLELGQPILPSMLCITRQHEILFGRQAVERFLLLTRETPIRYKFTDLRALTSVFENELAESPMTESSDGLVWVSSAGEDEQVDAPARLFQSLKIGLRDPRFHGTTIYGRYYALEELIALTMRHIREQAEYHLGVPVRAAVIGRPVSYASADHPLSITAQEIDRTAHERMLAAARIAGFTHAALEFEPVAAARYLLPSLPQGTCALVFDFGGGTLDLALSRMASPRTAEGADGSSPAQGPGLEIIGTHGVLVGGDDLDSAIMRHSLLKHFGLGTTLSSKKLPFPPNILAPLQHWQTIPLLAQPAMAAHIAALKRQSNSPRAVENLQCLVGQGLGFQLFQRIESAKILLSSRPETQIVFTERGLHISERLTRAAFVDGIGEHLGQIESGIHALLLQARRDASDVQVVLMTGGSSQVPVVQGLVHRLFPQAHVRVADPFTSIVSGLAVVAARDDICESVGAIVSEATAERLRAEAVTIGETVAFQRGHQTVEGVVVRRAGGYMHDAILVIEFWDQEIEQFISTMRHETKVQRLRKGQA